MTAIEEAGKLAVLRFFANGKTEEPGVAPQDVDVAALTEFLRDRPEKAREAVTSSLAMNAGADRRHGVHPRSGMHRTSGLILLVRSGQWMKYSEFVLVRGSTVRSAEGDFPRRSD